MQAQEPTPEEALVLALEQAFAEGALDRALVAAKAIAEGRARRLGPDHLDHAAALRDLAIVQFYLRDGTAAVETLDRVVAIHEQAGVPDTAALVKALSDAGAMLTQLGRLADAEQRIERALAVATERLGPDDLGVADLLLTRASIRSASGDVRGAVESNRRALAVRERQLGPDDPAVAEAASNLALKLRVLGAFAESRALLERALAIFEAQLGPDHENTAVVANNLAMLLEDVGHLEEAAALYERFHAVAVAKHGPDDALVGTALNNLAAVRAAQGRFSEARALYADALRIREAELGPDHHLVAQVCNNLANVLSTLGQPAEARALYERAVTVQRAARPEDPDTALFVRNLAHLLADQGDAEAAARLLEETIASVEQSLGPESPALVLQLETLSDVRSRQGRPDEALAAAERAVSVAEAVYGPEHAAVADALVQLGARLAESERLDEASAALERAVAVLAARFPEGHPTGFGALAELGTVRREQGRLEDAERLLDAALAGLTATVPGSAKVAATHGERARVRHLRARDEADRDDAAEALRLVEALVAESLDFTSERERLALVRAHRQLLDLHVAVHLDDPAVVWEAVLRWKGVVGRAMVAQRRSGREDDPEVEALGSELDRLRGAIAHLTFAPQDPATAAARLERLEALRREREEVERALARLQPGALALAPTPALGELCADLPGATLLDLLARTTPDGRRVYSAFVVDDRCEIAHVDLGPAEPIEAATARYRSLMYADASPARIARAGEAVRALVWDPVRGAIAGDRVVVVPDGALAGVSFAGLPDGDRFLVEDLTFVYADGAASLLAEPPSAGEGALVVGDVGYGAPTEGADPCAYRSFAALPATAIEAEEAAGRFARARRREEVLVLTGAEASEENLRDRIAGRRLVHLATHGFFATEACRDRLVGEGALYNPMVFSGLALAGVNDRAGPDDGVFTAEEVAGLDLRAAEIVVLSACETGLGEVAAGEGVLGLRRALALAGASSALMSLWTVPDEETRQLMDGFYALRLARRPVDTADALRRAQLELLSRQRERGVVAPQRWAAFIASE